MIRQSFPVVINTHVYRENGTEIYFPQMVDYHNRRIQQKINKQIEKTVFQLVTTQKEQQSVDTFDQMIGLFEVKTNERNVLSVTFSNYAIHEYFAHGLTFIASCTFDLETGNNWLLNELFIEGTDYKTTLATIVNEQIDARHLPVFDQPVTVRANQDYYIADKALVIYYQLYEISPYYVGLPMFLISVYEVEDLLSSDSLLTRMLA